MAAIKTQLSTMQAQYEAEQSRFEDESRNSMRLLSSANQKLTELQNESNRLQRENQEFVIAALGKKFEPTLDDISRFDRPLTHHFCF